MAISTRAPGWIPDGDQRAKRQRRLCGEVVRPPRDADTEAEPSGKAAGPSLRPLPATASVSCLRWIEAIGAKLAASVKADERAQPLSAFANERSSPPSSD
jgi:hypothetical protein